jgi:beta-glucosidase
MKYFYLAVVVLFIHFGVNSQSIDHKVDSIISRMTLEEKVGQMAQVERSELENIQDIATFSIGSILSGGGSSPNPNTRASWANMYNNYQSIALQSSLGIPIIYGIDAVHGHNNVFGAVIFPHNIGLGCTWNPDLIRLSNQIIAKEVAATGIDWTFAPCIAVPRNEKWGRTYEGFGETAEIQKVMGRESILGLQGSDLSSKETILACAKHYVGDGGTIDGIDQGNNVDSEDSLRSIHMQGYIDAIEVKVGSIMASYSSWNGQKLHGHQYLLSNVLRNELGFEGFVISDWKGVDQIDEDYRTSLKRAINAGIDMVMVPDRYEIFINHVVSLVQDNEISEYRIDDAVRRILKQKFLLNLFEEPYTDLTLASSFGSQNHRNVARQAVRESLVLLNAKNNVLPLKKNNQKILVAGTLSKDLGAQCGGWTISWQGSNGNITTGTDILTGIQNLSETSEIIYAPNGNFDESVDIAVVVIGEKTPYAEGAGDRTSLKIDNTDINLMKSLKQSGIPTIAVLISGRPMIIGDILPYTDAIIAAWYPGTEGDGIAEVLFGEYQPTGKLTHSWPREMSQIPINFYDSNYSPLFEYKHGLQEFPESISAEKLCPYTICTNKTGDTILLALSDQITTMNADISDFEIKIDGVIVPDLISDINFAEYDSSIVLLSLNDAIKHNKSISLTYFETEIISNNLTLKSFENYYVFNSIDEPYTSLRIPGRIEAEDFYEMDGIQTESCTDIGGGENVGYIDEGDWMKYHVEVTQAGLYRIVARISGYASGSLLFSFDDVIQFEVNYSSTDGWQNWQDFASAIYLEEGLYVMSIKAQSNAFNINYFDFNLVGTNINNNVSLVQNIKVYPNPVSEKFKVELLSVKRQKIKIKLIDPTGKITEELHNGVLNQGTNTFTFSIPLNLSSGIYFLEIKTDSKRYFKKIIK